MARAAHRQNPSVGERAIERLFARPPFPPRRGGEFVSALRECAELQSRRFPVIARLYARSGFRPSHLRSERDLARLPYLHVSVFKEFPFKPSSPLSYALTVTSSGTSGQKGQNRLDAGSLARVKKSARAVYGALGMVAPELETNYLCFP